VDRVCAKARTTEATRAPRAVPLAQPRGELAGMLVVSYPRTRLADMALSESVQGRLERVIRKQRQRERLRSHELALLRKLLLVGPPGTGRTMTASALA
jgi:SpoVK/Ycf46/Vps4 family AAA+-type ATPase